MFRLKYLEKLNIGVETQIVVRKHKSEPIPIPSKHESKEIEKDNYNNDDDLFFDYKRRIRGK